VEFLDVGIAEQQKVGKQLLLLVYILSSQVMQVQNLVVTCLILYLHTKSENGIPKRARVLQWVVTNPLWDLEFVQKQWCLAKPILAVRQLYMSHCKTRMVILTWLCSSQLHLGASPIVVIKECAHTTLILFRRFSGCLSEWKVPNAESTYLN